MSNKVLTKPRSILDSVIGGDCIDGYCRHTYVDHETCETYDVYPQGKDGYDAEEERFYDDLED